MNEFLPSSNMRSSAMAEQSPSPGMTCGSFNYRERIQLLYQSDTLTYMLCNLDVSNRFPLPVGWSERNVEGVSQTCYWPLSTLPRLV